MGSQTDRWYLTGLVLLGSALVLGLAATAIIAALEGRTGQMFAEDLPASLIMLAAFVIVGVVAGLATRRGNVVGFSALFGGLVVVAALHFLGYVGEEQGLKKGAWTGAALTKGLFVCAGVPGALIGSFIGGVIGLAILRSRDNRANNNPDSRQMQAEPEAAADRPRE